MFVPSANNLNSFHFSNNLLIGDRRLELQDSPIDLSALHSLVSLELRNNVYDFDQTPFSQRVALILCTLPKPTKLAQLTLYCPGYEFATHIAPSCALQWRAINSALSHSDIPFLRQIHFKMGANIFPTRLNLLPWATSRGVKIRISKMLRTV